MGMIYRKQYTMPVPAGAEVTGRNGSRVARWRLRNGQQRSGEVVDCQDGKLRVRGQSRLYMARYRNGSGEVVEVATNCKDEVAARAVLVKLERNAELVRSGILTPEESDSAGHADQPIAKHDERNRVVDIHALRVTFGTHLCAAGVPLRTAQAAMRHSKPELTANVYTDPKLLDVAGAINALPSLTAPSVATPTGATLISQTRSGRRRATS